MASEEKKTLICFDALNWLDRTFWNNNADLQYCADPWEALRHSDRTVATFVRAAQNADFDLVVVASGGPVGPENRAIYERRRDLEITTEKRNVCLGADMFLAESFQERGVRVVKPVGAGANDVLAALAASNDRAVIVSGNGVFFRCDRALKVCRDFTVSGGKLLLDRTVTGDPSRIYHRRSRETNQMIVEPHLAVAAMGGDLRWTLGHASKYRSSIKTDGKVILGSSSSSDRRMGNLHALARPLRAAVYAILGEASAIEIIPEWSIEEQVLVWTETEVDADPALIPVVRDPHSALEWLVKHDTAMAQMEAWRAAERHFNMCCLAAELVAVACPGTWTMHKCMELFSKDEEIAKRAIPSPPPADTSVSHEIRLSTSQHPPSQGPGSVAEFDTLKPIKCRPVLLFRRSQPTSPPASEETTLTMNVSSSSRARDSIFGGGRPREEVLKERGIQDEHL